MTLRRLSWLAASAATTILMGSYVPIPRLGNTKAPGLQYRGDIFYVDPETGEGINAIGLKDSWGIDGLKEYLPEMVRRAHECGKKLRISFAGFFPDDFVRFLAMVYSLRDDHRLDEIEFNFGCPNAAGHGIISYNPDLVREIMIASVEAMPQQKPIALDVKFSPFQLERHMLLTEVCMRGVMPFCGERGIRCVVTSNTVPDQQMEDSEGRPRIAALVQDGPMAGAVVHQGGQGGGDSMLAVACGEATAWHMLLPPQAGLIVVGGIRGSTDLDRLIRAGGGLGRVQGAQIGTAFFAQENRRIFTDLMIGSVLIQ